MASKNKEQNKNIVTRSASAVRSKTAPIVTAIAWLLETTARAFVGYYLLNGSHGYIMTVVGMYFSVSAVFLIAKHFFNAHK